MRGFDSAKARELLQGELLKHGLFCGNLVESNLTPALIDAPKLDKLVLFMGELSRWGRVHNLTGSLEIQAMVWNIVDALLPLHFITQPRSVLDVGSGCGYPALPLAIALDDIDFALIEPRGKRASFLSYVAGKVASARQKIRVLNARVEAVSNEMLGLNLSDFHSSQASLNEKPILVTSRALSSNLGDLIGHLCYNELLVFLGEDARGIDGGIAGLDWRTYVYTKRDARVLGL